VKILLFLITANIVILGLSVFIDLAFAEPNDVIVIEKPKFCNSANLSYYYTLEEFQEEYKYPCATYCKSVTFLRW
jgi:hypothetical protein